MREYFKTTSIPKEIKEFRNFCKKNGADFIEGEGDKINGVWIIPKQYGEFRLAIIFNKGDGLMRTRKIIESCQNFEKCSGGFYKEELIWMRKIFEKLEKYKEVKNESNKN